MAKDIEPVDKDFTEEPPVVETPVVAPVTEQAPRTYAGKFKSPEELEASYTELQRKLGSQGQELASVRQEYDGLRSQLETKAPATPEKSVDQRIQEVAKAYENGDLTFEQQQAQIATLIREDAEAKFTQREQALTESLRNEFTRALSERDQQKVIKDFHDKNPEFQPLVESGKLDEIKASNPLHDDYSAFLAYQNQQLQEQINTMKLESGKEPAKKTLDDAGYTASKEQNKPKLSGRDLEQSMLKSIQEAV